MAHKRKNPSMMTWMLIGGGSLAAYYLLFKKPGAVAPKKTPTTTSRPPGAPYPPPPPPPIYDGPGYPGGPDNGYYNGGPAFPPPPIVGPVRPEPGSELLEGYGSIGSTGGAGSLTSGGHALSSKGWGSLGR